MKSQSLPIQTIVMIIIVIVVLAAVLIFFYSQFSKNNSIQNRQTFSSRCQTIVSQIQGSNPQNENDVISRANALNYCKKDPSTGLRCNDTLSATIEYSEGKCTLGCSGDSATCS